MALVGSSMPEALEKLIDGAFRRGGLMFDGDDAGRSTTEEIAACLRRVIYQVMTSSGWPSLRIWRWFVCGELFIFAAGPLVTANHWTWLQDKNKSCIAMWMKPARTQRQNSSSSLRS